MSYICTICGYFYNPENGDEENGIAPNTEFDDVSNDWTCPLCGADKEEFEPCENEEYV